MTTQAASSMNSVSLKTRILSRLLLPVVIVALPLVLLLSSVRTFQELDEQKALYLRIMWRCCGPTGKPAGD